MKFVDETVLECRAGSGGNGSSAMRREKYVPLGGPAGGDGGHGGDIVFVASHRLSTLLDLHHHRILKAANGEHGRGKDQHGACAKALEVKVPVGTVVFDANTGEKLADLHEADQYFIAAQGGAGGRGNRHFVTSFNRAPVECEGGEAGEVRTLRLELKLMADVGLVGLPNVGKSTFISRVSRARPKIADYPFTTLVPNLGMVRIDDEREFVVADIPGIVDGAAMGTGLGLQFLRHIERTRALVFLVSPETESGRTPLEDYEMLRGELGRYQPALLERPCLLVVSKLDLPEMQDAFEVLKKEAPADLKVYAISSATGQGIDVLVSAIADLVL